MRFVVYRYRGACRFLNVFWKRMEMIVFLEIFFKVGSVLLGFFVIFLCGCSFCEVGRVGLFLFKGLEVGRMWVVGLVNFLGVFIVMFLVGIDFRVRGFFLGEEG